MTSNFPEDLIKASRTARRVVVFTGAGISAESGLPTFREAQTGLWAKYDPLELATPDAFRRNPTLVWQWYAWRRQLAEDAAPNPGHLAVAQMDTILNDLTVVTQNIDGLHQRAGSSDVIELHGNIHRVACFDCRHRPVDWDHAAQEPPACPLCGGMLAARCGLVWRTAPGCRPPERHQCRQERRSLHLGWDIGAGPSCCLDSDRSSPSRRPHA